MLSVLLELPELLVLLELAELLELPVLLELLPVLYKLPDLCKKLNITPIATKIKNSQIQWFGHVRRRPSDHPISLAYNYKVDGTRPTGRPRKRWHQYINEYLMEKGSSLSEVEANKTFDDRAKWATLTKIFLN